MPISEADYRIDLPRLVERLVEENWDLRRENLRLRTEISGWVDLAMGNITAHEKQTWDLIASGLLTGPK